MSSPVLVHCNSPHYSTTYIHTLRQYYFPGLALLQRYRDIFTVHEFPIFNAHCKIVNKKISAVQSHWKLSSLGPLLQEPHIFFISDEHDNQGTSTLFLGVQRLIFCMELSKLMKRECMVERVQRECRESPERV